MAEFDDGLRRFADRLVALGREMETAVAAGLIAVGEKAAKRAGQLTPRSDEGGPHVADGWTVEVQASAAGTLVVEVFNRLDKANERITLQGGGETSLLEILEFGTLPHQIRAINARALHFTTREGDEIFTKVVEHPGTRPYAMLGIATTEAAIDMKRLVDKLRQVIRSAAT
jgi:hypothetical protein